MLELFALDTVEVDRFRASAGGEGGTRLYGGLVAAQALFAAGLTVPKGRTPHSLHGYFLRGGAVDEPTEFVVSRDRDGRSYSARRVTAIQRGAAIFTMSASFSVPEPGDDRDVDPPPEVPGPDALPGVELGLRSIEARLLPQARPGLNRPTRFWARCTVALPESPVLHASVLTYLSDTSSGLTLLRGDGFGAPGASLDHAVWFHRPVRMDDWVLMDLVPHTVAGARGWYTGTLRQRDGQRVASLTQEALFRREKVRPQ